MAKLKAPLLSLGASQQLGKTLVYFAWKGLNVVREYVVPSNPKTDLQNTQRGYVTAGVAMVHAAMADATHPLNEVDKTAYALLGTVIGGVMTWFNAAVKAFIDQNVAGLQGAVFHGAVLTPAATQVTLSCYFQKAGANDITAMNVKYGTSKTALLSTEAFTKAELNAGKAITGLTNGVKYYFQIQPTAHADFVGCNSGIFYATPVA